MPSQRKRIGFLPSEEVHQIIDKLCRESDFSQSKVTGLLVEEALRFRGLLTNSFSSNISNKYDSENLPFDQKKFAINNNTSDNSGDYKVNKKVFSEDIKMIHEFIEFKYFKKIMRQNDNIYD